MFLHFVSTILRLLGDKRIVNPGAFARACSCERSFVYLFADFQAYVAHAFRAVQSRHEYIRLLETSAPLCRAVVKVALKHSLQHDDK